jgi:glycosyltransferase involved in cell wall biosynthesis
MKSVIWFSPVLLPEMYRALGLQSSVRGGWIPGLLSALRQYVPQLHIIVVAIGQAKQEKEFLVDGVTYHILPVKAARLFSDDSLLSRAKQLIVKYEAGLVHVHGTESVFSRLACDKDVSVPVCVSIQGLLTKYLPHLVAGVSYIDVIRWQLYWREILQLHGPFFNWLTWRRQAKREREVLAKGRYFIGRTQWDRANVLAQNPTARYLHGDEVLRDVFYRNLPRKELREKPIILLGRATPIKGITVFIEMLDILLRRNQAFEARIFGQFRKYNGLGRMILSRIHKYGLGRCVKFLGSLDEMGVAHELLQATIFVHPSFMDNSPNSICEAMMVGTPVIATYCGGVPSLIKDGETGVLVPPGDAESLADAVIALLNDATYRNKIAETAQIIATRRHDMKNLANDYWNIYSTIMRISP